MSVIHFGQTYTYDDILIQPAKISSVSHKDCSLETRFSKTVKIPFPIVMAPMAALRDRVKMANLYYVGVPIWLDRYMSLETLDDMCRSFSAYGFTGINIAVNTKSKDYLPRLDMWLSHSCSKDGAIKIDVANGASKHSLATVYAIKKRLPEVTLFSGNVCSAQSAVLATESGADGIMVGIGGGSSCSTRLETGIGRGNADALHSIAKAVDKKETIICADGGFKKMADVFKALVLGADFCMSGRLFYTGTKYYGMASKTALKEVDKGNRSTEGETLVLPERTVTDMLRDIEKQWKGSLKSALSYMDASSIEELHEKKIVVRIITPAVYNESLAQ